MTTTYSAASSLNDAIGIFRSIALDAFNQGQSDALSTRGAQQTEAAWEQQKSKGKAAMQTALDQIAHADSLDSARQGRDEFDDLMTTAKSVSGQITTTMADTSGASNDQLARNGLIAALAATLQSIANLAPACDWDKAASSSSSG
jgi:hypothetical protein